jgi:hypothetical protein
MRVGTRARLRSEPEDSKVTQGYAAQGIAVCRFLVEIKVEIKA